MGQTFSSLECGNPCPNANAMFYLCKSQFQEKNPVPPVAKHLFLVLARKTITLQHLIINILLHCLPHGRLQEVKNKGKFQTFSSKSGRGHL